MAEKRIVTPRRMNAIFKQAAGIENRTDWYHHVSAEVGRLIFKSIEAPAVHRQLLADLMAHLHRTLHVEATPRRNERLAQSDVRKLFENQVVLARQLDPALPSDFSKSARAHADQIERQLIPFLDRRPYSSAALHTLFSAEQHERPFVEIAREMLVAGLRLTLNREKIARFWPEYVAAVNSINQEDARRKTRT